MVRLVELKCPNCTGRLEWTGGPDAACPHCGAQFLLPSQLRKRLACPKCGEIDRVQRVTAAATYTSRLRAPHQPTLPNVPQPVPETIPEWTGCARLAATASVVWGSLGLAGTVIQAACLCAGLAASPEEFGSLASEDQLSVIGVWLAPFLVGCLVNGAFVAVPIWLSRRKSREHRRRLEIEKARLKQHLDTEKAKLKEEEARWERAMRRWERLYYCARDDGVFVPGETPLLPIDELQDYLYREEGRLSGNP
jgi:phage FluMu protein Com